MGKIPVLQTVSGGIFMAETNTAALRAQGERDARALTVTGRRRADTGRIRRADDPVAVAELVGRLRSARYPWGHDLHARTSLSAHRHRPAGQCLRPSAERFGAAAYAACRRHQRRSR